MNLFKKVYCRIYQTAFHLAYPFLPYREPEILNSTLMISREIHAMGINSAMIVTDSFLHNSGAIDALKASLDENKIRYTVYDRTRPNPTAENIEQAFEIYSSQAFECLIGFGGVGESGMGSYHGRLSFDAFSHRRSVVVTPTWLDLPFRYMPYKMFGLVKKIL
mgnify:CR=1 FL=1